MIDSQVNKYLWPQTVVVMTKEEILFEERINKVWKSNDINYNISQVLFQCMEGDNKINTYEDFVVLYLWYKSWVWKMTMHIHPWYQFIEEIKNRLDYYEPETKNKWLSWIERYQNINWKITNTDTYIKPKVLHAIPAVVDSINWVIDENK